MKNLINIALVAFVAVFTVGCYSDFGTPEPAHVYVDDDFSDCEIISIYDFKQSAIYGRIDGADTDGSSDSFDYNDSEVIDEDWVLKGKVISSDESGNVYKSLFIQSGSVEDGTRAGIELRLFASNYTQYPIGSTVYVRLKGLSLGDYRGMVSVGCYSVQSMAEFTAAKEAGILTSDNIDDYINYIHTTIENRITLSEHIFLGESGEVTEDDILTITADNYDILNVDGSYLACLVRFEGLESAFTADGAASWTTYTYPSYFAENTTDGKFDWSSTLSSVDEMWATPPLAYRGTNPVTGSSSTLYYYGSSWFTYDRDSDSHQAQFILRLSGYARFKDNPIPSNGEKANITAIFTRYLNSSGYYTTYQLVTRFESDLEYLGAE